MSLNATARRRWLGAAVLFAALLMLIGGETLLKGQLNQTWFVLYWLICFLLTGLAISIAFLDAKIVQRRTRQEHRELLETTLRRIEKDAKVKKTQQSKGGQVRETGGFEQ